ncbi:hypothetical protein ASD08_44815 [Streptomyces sp. Root369]|nr:hypothetical protein ASD08_44815 [Streptomyces sp. Root369]
MVFRIDAEHATGPDQQMVHVHLLGQEDGMQDAPAVPLQAVQLGSHPLLPRQTLPPGVPLGGAPQEL